MTLPNFGIPDQAASEETFRGAIDANSQALASIIAPIVDYLTAGISANQKALNKITSAIKRQLTRGIQQNAQALGATSNALQQQILGGISNIGAQLSPIMAATSGPVPLIHPIRPGIEPVTGGGGIGPIGPIQPAYGGGGGGGDTGCVWAPPTCPPVPGTQYYCLHCVISPGHESWDVICTTAEQAEWERANCGGELRGPWNTYTQAYNCCCSHGASCDTSPPLSKANMPPITLPSGIGKIGAGIDWWHSTMTACLPGPPNTPIPHGPWALFCGYDGISFYWSKTGGSDMGGGVQGYAMCLPSASTELACCMTKHMIGLGMHDTTAQITHAPGPCDSPPPPPPPSTLPGGGGGDTGGGGHGTDTCPTSAGSSCDKPIYFKLCNDDTPPPIKPGPICTDPGTGIITECPPPPPPIIQPPIVPTGGLLECGLLPDGSLPPVGSPEWCSCIEALQAAFTEIGQQALAILGLGSSPDSTGASSALLGMLAGPLAQLPLVGTVLQGLQAGITSVAGSAWSMVANTVGTQLVGGGAQLLGLSVARTVINLLRRFRLGTDLAVWATIDLELIVQPIERIIDYLIDYTLPTEIPSIADAIEAYKYNTASEGLVRCWLLLRGANPSVWLPIINARREKLQAHESIELDRRHGQDEVTQVQSLRNLGFTDERDAIARVELYDEIPSIADHLHWLQRNVFDDQYVADYGLMEGFTERFWAKFGADLRTKGMLEKYAALHYAAHWVNPAPGQLLEMVYRLRPGKPGVENPFTLDDYARILVEQDVSPYFRKRFAEIAYRVPAMGYVRDMYRNHVITDEELRSIHQDLGYSPKDSERFLDIDKLVKARMRASEGHGWTPGALAGAYAIRQIDQLRVRSEMSAQGFTDTESAALMERADADFQRTIISRARSRVLFAALTEIRQAITAGVIDQQGAVTALIELGWPEQFAVGWASMQLASASVALVKQVTARVRAAFLAGEIGTEYVAIALAQLNLVPDAVARFLQAWSVEMTPRRRRRQANQIVADLSLNEISRADALLRLTNLGYDEADQMLYLADAQRKVIGREQQILAAEQKTERMHAQAVEKAQREAARQAKEELQYLKMLSPVGKMQRWASLGLMGRDRFFERMRTFGYDDPDTERYYEEACARKKSACVESAPEPPGPPPGNGESGFP